jgi:broad specificity phosphatase PhoE
MKVTPADGRVYLVRHGRVHNPRRVAYGFLPRMGLAPDGEEQARRAGLFLCAKEPVAIFSSPLLRAVQTRRLIHAAMPHLPVHASWLLRENELARVWQGTGIAERPALFPEEYRLFRESPSLVTAGETMAAQAERMLVAIRRALSRYPGGPLIVVSHRDPITALRLLAEGRSFDELHATQCETGSITEFQFEAGLPVFTGYVEP